MINFFQIAPQDASMSYLGRIFGNVSNVINSGDNTNILSNMFLTFNSVILTVAILMLVYVTVLGVIGTAHEGEFMGKKMNNIWIPIRAVLGVALLVPTAAGYCGIQIIMMWVIVQGIGAADTLWNGVLAYKKNVGSVYGQVSIPSVDTTQKLSMLFQGLVCDAALSKSDPKNIGGYYNSDSPGRYSGPPTFDPNATQYALGPGGACGAMTYCDQSTNGSCKTANSLECLICKQQIASLQSIIPTLAALAQQVVAADYSYRDFYVNSATQSNNNDWQWIYSYCASTSNVNGSSKKAIPKDQCCVKGVNSSPIATCKAPDQSLMPYASMQVNGQSDTQGPSTDAVQNVYWGFWPAFSSNLGNFIKTSADEYTTNINLALNAYLQANGNNQDFDGLMKSASDNGWIYAGGFYYLLARFSDDNLQKSIPTFDYSPADSGFIKNYRNDFDAGQVIAAAAGGSYPNGVTSSLSGGGSQIGNAALDGVSSSFIGTVNSTDGDPLVVIQVFGRIMLVIAQVAFVALVAFLMALGIAGNISVYVLGTGITNPLGGTEMLIGMFVIPLVLLGLGILVSLGALLGIYTPLLPYIYFTFGAIGWLISTIETMVAGPLVALGIISPSGHHEVMGKAEPALMLLFNVFLRPSLMIFGLVAAMLLATVVVTLISGTFAFVFLVNFVAVDFLTLLLVLIAYVSLILAALNKCFAVINIIPQQVMRWISGQGEGVDAPTQEIKGGVEAGASKAGGFAESHSRNVMKDSVKSAEKQKGDGSGTGITGGK